MRLDELAQPSHGVHAVTIFCNALHGLYPIPQGAVESLPPRGSEFDNEVLDKSEAKEWLHIVLNHSQLCTLDVHLDKLYGYRYVWWVGRAVRGIHLP